MKSSLGSHLKLSDTNDPAYSVASAGSCEQRLGMECKELLHLNNLFSIHDIST